MIQVHLTAIRIFFRFFNKTTWSWNWNSQNWTRKNYIFVTLQLKCIKPSRRTLNYWTWALYDSIVFFLFLSPLYFSLLLVVWKDMEFVTEQPYWLFKLNWHHQKQTQASRHKSPLMLVDRVYFLRDYFYMLFFFNLFSISM